MTVAIKGVYWVLLILLHYSMWYIPISKEHRLLDGVDELFHILSKTLIFIKVTQIAVLPPTVWTWKWWKDKSAVQGICDEREKKKLVMDLTYGLHPITALTGINTLNCHVLPHCTILTIHIKTIELHFFEAQLLTKTASYVIVMENVVVTIF